ncbi:hypothetical protein SAMN02745121_03115 [Nannocystis exedens]|uniref:Uncharacterized protein n=1 Tax=Nannocystis exedens TaxID=54 RepID=A0A1I1Y712_9BACT|nr:hypothetical protein NAEX_04842 [Nannocystis exedens]SFE13640.1 hypothetical protein SAMN02745121_03115 [Nannocystis exedens]
MRRGRGGSTEGSAHRRVGESQPVRRTMYIRPSCLTGRSECDFEGRTTGHRATHATAPPARREQINGHVPMDILMIPRSRPRRLHRPQSPPRPRALRPDELLPRPLRHERLFDRARAGRPPLVRSASTPPRRRARSTARARDAPSLMPRLVPAARLLRCMTTSLDGRRTIEFDVRPPSARLARPGPARRPSQPQLQTPARVEERTPASRALPPPRSERWLLRRPAPRPSPPTARPALVSAARLARGAPRRRSRECPPRPPILLASPRSIRRRPLRRRIGDSPPVPSPPEPERPRASAVEIHARAPTPTAPLPRRGGRPNPSSRSRRRREIRPSTFMQDNAGRAPSRQDARRPGPAMLSRRRPLRRPIGSSRCSRQ